MVISLESAVSSLGWNHIVHSSIQGGSLMFIKLEDLKSMRARFEAIGIPCSWEEAIRIRVAINKEDTEMVNLLIDNLG